MLWNTRIKSVQGLEVLPQVSNTFHSFALHLVKNPYTLYTGCRLQDDTPECHALLFSTGFDSTACLYLNPKIEYSFYICRKGMPQGMLRQEKALDSLQKFANIFPDKKFFIIETDVEKLRQPYGYIGDFGMAIPLIPHLEHFGITHLNFGMIGDVAHLQSSQKYRPFIRTATYLHTVKSFESVGIKVVLPTATLFDHCTKHICTLENVTHLTSSCLRGTIEKPCGKCRKCFKEGINLDKGRRYFGSEQNKIFTNPPKLMNLYPAWKQNRHIDLFPNVKEDLDLSWFEHFHYREGWVCDDEVNESLIKSSIDKYFNDPSSSQVNTFKSLNTASFIKN
jgi:hypothetical protein